MTIVRECPVGHGSGCTDEPADHADGQCHPTRQIRVAAGVRSVGPLSLEQRKARPGTPTSGILSFQGLDPHLRTAYAYIYHFTIQRQAGPMFLDVTYQGSAGRHLGCTSTPTSPRYRARPGTARTGCAERTDFSLSRTSARPDRELHRQLALRWRTLTVAAGPRDVSFHASYTLGKSLDYNSSYFGSGNQTGETGRAHGCRNLRLEHGPSAFDIRQRLTAFFVVDVPAPCGTTA